MFDAAFVQANKMLKAVKVESKQKGKGVHKLYLLISQNDLECTVLLLLLVFLSFGTEDAVALDLISAF